MNESDRAIPYVVVGIGIIALLAILGWLALREPSAPTNEQPAEAVSAMSRERHVTPPLPPVDEPQSEGPASPDLETVETNAATIYRQAFALYDALSKEQKEIVSNWRTNVDASVEAELCKKIQPICDRMHQAAAVSNCDWGVEQPMTSATRLPYLNSCRNVARAAVWSVAHCRSGDPSAAVDDLVATSRLGRNVSSPPILISHLVDLAIQGIVIASVSEHAGVLAGPSDTRLAQLFNDANYDVRLARVFGQEADMLSRRADRLVTMPREEAMRELEPITSFADKSSELQSMEPAQAIAYIRQAVELQREYAEALELPEAEYREWLEWLKAAEKTNPFVESLVSVLGSVVDRTQRATISAAMVGAGLAVMRDGPDALQLHPDPATGQPFVYTRTADGFELQSNSSYQIMDKPLKLSFK
jgi:hypothetical protein